jgi:hypothetical protein
MMKKNNIVIAAVIIILLLLLGVGGYLMLNKNTSSSNTAATKVASKPTEAGQTRKSLLDLIKIGQNVRCTFRSEVANGSTEGTVYVSGQNVRGDFNIKTTSDGKTMQTSMIKTGDTNYVWGSSMTTGIKMTISLDKLAQNKQASQYVDPNQKVDYNCTPWNVDASLFTPPSNIKFTDMTSLLAPKENITGTKAEPAQTKMDTSAICNQITDPTAKAACENALKQSGQ